MAAITEGADAVSAKRNPPSGGPTNSSTTVCVPAICALARSSPSGPTACGRIATAALSETVSTTPMTA